MSPVAALESAATANGPTIAALTEKFLADYAHRIGSPRYANYQPLRLALIRRDRPVLEKWLRENPIGDGRPNALLLKGLDDPASALAALRGSYQTPANRDNYSRMMGAAIWAAYFGDDQLALDALRAIGPTASLHELWRLPLSRARQLSGFKQFAHELGFVDYWRSTGAWGDFCRPVGADDFACQ